MFANTSDCGEVCLFSQNEPMILDMKNVQFEVEKFHVITACCCDIYGRYFVQKGSNDYFHS